MAGRELCLEPDAEGQREELRRQNRREEQEVGEVQVLSRWPKRESTGRQQEEERPRPVEPQREGHRRDRKRGVTGSHEGKEEEEVGEVQEGCGRVGDGGLA